ncbi:MAG: hypothetical protein M3R38_29820 [Actinomycetota bacterium]|nr:hypothetical protein [Actinomycetota bacterium]
MHQPVDDMSPESPWDLWDAPYTRHFDNLSKNKVVTFVLFLADDKAKKWEIAGMTTPGTLTLRLQGEGGSEIYFTAHTAQTKRDDRYVLYHALCEYPKAMPAVYRQKLADQVGLWFSLEKFQGIA